MDLNSIPIQVISTCAILVPLLLAAFKLNTGDSKIRLFFIFLLFGALVDAYGWYVYSNEQNPIPHSILQYSYLFFEAIFFVWLCTEFLNFTKAKVLRKVFYILLFMTFVYKGWVLYSTNWNSSLAAEINSLLDGVFLVSISFLSAFALLHIAEKEYNILQFPWFWILSGIFLYCFGSFFIDILVQTGLFISLFKLRNYVNIIQYGFFIVGVLKIKPG